MDRRSQSLSFTLTAEQLARLQAPEYVYCQLAILNCLNCILARNINCACFALHHYGIIIMAQVSGLSFLVPLNFHQHVKFE